MSNKAHEQFLQTYKDSLNEMSLSEIEKNLKEAVRVGMISEAERVKLHQSIINERNEFDRAMNTHKKVMTGINNLIK